MKLLIPQNIRKNSDDFLESHQQGARFKDYLEKKVQTIQQTKLKTIKMTEKYFSQLKEKIDKYLAKEQKKILNAYEDNINMSINCVNHGFLYDLEMISLRNQKIQRKLSKESSLVEDESKTRKKSYQSQSELAIKIQVKRLIDEMLLAQTHLNEFVRLIGDELKSEMQKIISPLGDLFSKIPKLTQINQNSSTVLIKDIPVINEKKKSKNFNKIKKNQIESIKNPQIYSYKKIKSVNEVCEIKQSSHMTERLFKKLNIQKENLQEFQPQEQKQLLKLISILQKQDKIIFEINKNWKQKDLLTFDMINGKSIFHVYQNHLEIPLTQGQIDQQQHQVKYQIWLNDRPLLQEQSSNQWKYENYSKIEFESKPDRQYLAILTSKQSTFQQGEDTRKLKNYKIAIYNYKGDLITKDLVSNLKLSESEKPIDMFQISAFRQYVFLVFNNRVKRYSLRNVWDQKTRLFSNEEKIVKASKHYDKIVLYEGRKQQFYLLSHELILIQTFKWQIIHPTYLQLKNITTLKIPTDLHNIPVDFSKKEVSIIIPSFSTDSFCYFDGSLIKRLQLACICELDESKGKIPKMGMIEGMHQIQSGVYLVISYSKQWMGQKWHIFILEIKQMLQDQNKLLKGKVSYLKAIDQDIVNSKMINNRLYLTLKTGKVVAFSLC